MAVCRCKMCGGDLPLPDPNGIVECEFCGSKQTVTTMNEEKVLNLYNRANRLRMASEFDKAAALYENIIAEYPEEAEAYWGLCLCNYGIEYVDDPETGNKIPTCHRASFQKLREDENFELAMEYSDVVAQKVYRDEARIIDEIMDGILSISRNEKPYDIFICYKETDENGERTEDSVLGQDIYDALTDKGYKVFFSRISLEDKLGQQYEPYIFSALNSSKIMLSLGTKYEYFHAVWVKNEWSRFLKLMKKDKEKILIPCYKGIDAYDMPDEFKGMQAQDMGKLGYIQDLVRGIQKLTAKEETVVIEEHVSVGSSNSIEPLVKRIVMFLEDGEWNKADEYCEDVLNQVPEYALVYVYKFMAENEVHKESDLVNCYKLSKNDKNIQKAYRFGDEELKNSLDGYIEEARRIATETAYSKALSLYKNGNFLDALDIFNKIPDYKDSSDYVKKCRDETAGILPTLREIVEHKDNYRNCKSIVERIHQSPYPPKKIEEDLVKKLEELAEIERMYGNRKEKAIVLINDYI